MFENFKQKITMEILDFIEDLISPNYKIDVLLDAEDVSLTNKAKAITQNEKDFDGDFSIRDSFSEHAEMQDLELQDMISSNYNYNNFSSAYHFFDDLSDK